MSLTTEDGRLIEELRVVDLKEELDKRGLSKNGKKQELYERLKEVPTSPLLPPPLPSPSLLPSSPLPSPGAACRRC